MTFKIQNIAGFIVVTVICSMLLLPTLTLATNNSGDDGTSVPSGLTIGGPGSGTFGDNGWYITKPTYSVTWWCGGNSINGPWSPDEGNHSYDWGLNLGTTGGGSYVRADGGSWTSQGGGGCGSVDNTTAIVKSMPNLKVDTVPPTVDIGTPYEGEAFQQNQVTLTGHASDQTSGLASFTMDGAPINVGADSGFNENLTKNPGVYTVTFVAKDLAGNITSVTRTFKILENATSASTTANIQSPSANAPSASVSTSTSNKNPSNTALSQVATDTTPPATNESTAQPITTIEPTTTALSDSLTDQAGRQQTTNAGSVKGANNTSSLPVAGTAVAVSSLGGLAFFLVRKFVFKV